MSKIKIISDPYHLQTSFQHWEEDRWVPISEVEDGNSKLLKKEYTQGFFPFKACEIVDVLLSEYGDKSDNSEPLEIEFEGADDEWTELQHVCGPDYIASKVMLTRSDRALANARDILPLIRDAFDEVQPIIASQAFKDNEMLDQLRKFNEASSNKVPICVVGNYSAGKSTFINALIGVELLPSSDRPMTARIFQIERADQSDRATIKFEYAGVNISIVFTEDGVKINPPDVKGQLLDDISVASANDDCKTIIDRVRGALGAINSYKSTDDNPSVSDLIKVSVPFAKETTWGAGKQIVVFDTPGSNSSSNVDHTRVLKDAMKGMSDGLPIFVTIYDSLDSTDNANLYDVISEIPALDEHFAMIVVNKADDADLPEGGYSLHKDWVMETVVARSLYAQGIYFVSSIAGLAAKTGGEFSERHYDRVYRRLKDSFEDPDDKYYMRLYDYDLLPEQMRVQMAQQSEECPNTVLANSGLFSIECGIDEFTNKYSAYNKCTQSGDLFNRLVNRTDAMLDKKSVETEDLRSRYQEEFDNSRDTLLDELLHHALEASSTAIVGYLPNMNEWAKKSLAASELTSETLALMEEGITKRKQRELGAEEKRRNAEDKGSAVYANLKARAQNVWDTKDVLGLTAVAKGFVTDVNAAMEAKSESENIFRGADQQASEELIELVRQQFDSDVNRLSNEVEAHSKSYWGDRSEAARKSLLDFVASGDAVNESQREALRKVIINYGELTLSGGKNDLLGLHDPFNPNKLWKAPLRLQYNIELAKRVSMLRSIIEPYHEMLFRNWIHDLVDILEDNAEDINPNLRKKLDALREKERELDALESMRSRIRRVEKTVSSYMQWQEG